MTDSLLPARLNLQVWESSTYRKTITLLSGGLGSSPLNLTGYTAQMTVRTAPLAPVIYTLSTSNAQITLGGPAGTIALYISATDTANQAFFPQAGGVYELTITAPGPGDTSPLMWGTVQVRGLAG